MKIKFYTLLLAAVSLQSFAQTGPAFTMAPDTSSASDSSFVFSTGIDTFYINTTTMPFATQGQFIVCSGAKLVFKGTFSSTMPSFFLEPGAQLEIRDRHFYPNIYMRGNSSVDFDTTNQVMKLYHDSTAIISGFIFSGMWADSLVSSVSFDWTNWPGGMNPCGTTGIQNTGLKNSILISPLPAENFIGISSAENIESVSLFDLTGVEILSQKNTGKNFSMDVSRLPRGIYFLQIQSEGFSVCKKVVLN